MSLDSWSGLEQILTEDIENGEWLHLVSDSTPGYVWEHRQNMYEAQNQYD